MVAQRGYGVGAASSGQAKNSGAKIKTKTNSVTKAAEKEPATMSFTQLHALKTLPKDIERLEFEIDKLKTALGAPDLYTKEPKKFDNWVKELAKRERAVEAK